MGVGLTTPMLSYIGDEKEGLEFEETSYKRVVASPYIPYEDAKEIEKAVSLAWNRLDARTANRVRAVLNGQSDCRDVQDNRLDNWDGQKTTLKKEEYCDGNIPANPVPWAPLACPNFYLDWGELTRRVTEAIAHASQVYVEDYYDEVHKALREKAPKAVYWTDLFPGAGSVYVPVTGDEPNWSKLESELARTKTYGSTYARQALPGMETLRRSLGQQKEGRQGPDRPGVEALEMAKKVLVEREPVHPQDKPLYWWGDGGGPKPQGRAGVAPSKDYQVYGVAPALRLYSTLVTETSPRQVTFWVGCFTPPPFSSYVPIPLPIPVVKTFPRVNTEWVPLVEGYPVPHVQGVPR